MQSVPPQSPPADVERKLFDFNGAAAYLASVGANGVTPRTIRELVSRGDLAHVKIGKKLFVSKSAIDSWLTRIERRGRL